MKKHRGLVLGVVLIAGLLLAACGGSSQGGAANYTVTAKESGCSGGATYCWDPATLSVTSGQQVTISVQNPNAQPHTFVFKENVPGATKVELPANQNGSLSFTAPAAGTYTWYCDVPGHEQLGMTGTMTVK